MHHISSSEVPTHVAEEYLVAIFVLTDDTELIMIVKYNFIFI